MKNRIRLCGGWVAVTVLLLFLFTAATANAGKVDPFWKVQKEMIEKNVSSGKAAPGALLIEVFIKSTDMEKTKGRVESFGGNVRTIVGNIMTASLPEKAIIDAESWDELVYIEAGKPMKQLNDLANASTSVATVQAGTGLTQGYDGKGVIVGIIDSGIDLTHPAFLDANGESRVLYVWDQDDATGPGPTEIGSTYGTEYKHAAIMAGGVAQNDTVGHGTHVAGTAVGRDATYPGVAPEAGIIAVKYKSSTVAEALAGQSFSPYVVDAVNYIFEKAAVLGKPAVINLSSGTSFGAHDGTSLLEQALDAFVSESAGRAMTVSAGNEGGTEFPVYGDTGGIHLNYSVAAGNYGNAFMNLFVSGSKSYIDMWGPQDCSATVSMGIWGGGGWVDSTGYVANGSSTEKYLFDGATLLGWIKIDRSETANTQNGKWHTLIEIHPGSNYNPFLYATGISLYGSCPSFDAWASPDDQIFFLDYVPGVNPGDNSKSIVVPATASKVISVGAYATRVSWTDSGGNPQSDPLGLLDDLAYFSSRGPALESAQGTKPNVAAPGMYTISAYSSASSPSSEYVIDSQHVAMPGTSMAAPHVAGIVALLFQAYPGLSYDQIMTYLQSTARSDSFVGGAPNSDWGYGKVDALAAINAVVTDYPPGAGDGDYSGIAITGITDGATDVPDTKQDCAITFPRDSNSATCTTGEIFVVPASIPASASNTPTKGAWDATICSAGSALPASLSMADARNGTLSLSSQLGQGTFAFCVSKNVRDSESIRFGGKTVTFTTSSGGGGGGGGCSVAASNSRGGAAAAALSLMLGLPALARARRGRRS